VGNREGVVCQEVEWIEGAQLQRPLGAFDGGVRLTYPRQGQTAAPQGEDIAAAECQRAVEELVSSRRVVLIESDHEAGTAQGRGVIDSFGRSCVGVMNGGCPVLLPEPPTAETGMIGQGQERVCGGVAGLQLKGLLEQRNCL